MSDLVIRALEPHADADMDGFQEVYAAAELAEDPEVGLYSREDAVAMLTSDAAQVFEAFGAFVAGRMVAESILTGSTSENLELAQILLWVHPDHQRRGYGSTVLAHLEDHALRHGRRVLRVQARAGDRHAGNRRFAERHGYTLAMTEIERRRALPVDRDLLDRLAAEAAAYHEGYRIQSFVGPVPTALRPSYVALRNLLETEMPHGDLDLEVGRETVEDLDALDREHETAGRTDVTAIAVRNGEVVAYAHAAAPGGEARHVDQYGTLVHPRHRGHRLGMAVKCAQLRLLGEQLPDRAYVQTSNAEVNSHMVAINVALGFEVHQVWGEFEKRIGPAGVSDDD